MFGLESALDDSSMLHRYMTKNLHKVPNNTFELMNLLHRQLHNEELWRTFSSSIEANFPDEGGEGNCPLDYKI